MASAGGSADTVGPYAKKFPKYKRTGSLHVDCEGEAHRNAAMVVVDRLVRMPALAGPVKTWLDAREQQQARSNELKSGRWHETYCYLENLSKDWCTEFLAMLAKGTKSNVDIALLNSMDTHDATVIKKLFHFVAFTAPSTKLPRECLDKAVCSRTLKRRCTEVGDRIALVGDAVSSQGVVDWKKLGVYKLTFNEANKCVSVTHLSGATASVPDHIIVDTTYTLLGNDNDMTAFVKKGLAEYKLCELFVAKGKP